MHDDELPAWAILLESAAPWACALCLALIFSIVAYVFGADWFAGHWHP